MTAVNVFLWGWKGRRRKSRGAGEARRGGGGRCGGVDGISRAKKVTMTDF